MKAIDFEEANMSYTAPEGMDNCGTLRVHRTAEFSVSKWELTPAEKLQAFMTGFVYLFVWGQGHPPVALHALDPFNTPHEMTDAEVTNNFRKFIRAHIDEYISKRFMKIDLDSGLMIDNSRHLAEILNEFTDYLIQDLKPA